MRCEGGYDPDRLLRKLKAFAGKDVTRHLREFCDEDLYKFCDFEWDGATDELNTSGRVNREAVKNLTTASRELTRRGIRPCVTLGEIRKTFGQR